MRSGVVAGALFEEMTEKKKLRIRSASFVKVIMLDVGAGVLKKVILFRLSALIDVAPDSLAFEYRRTSADDPITMNSSLRLTARSSCESIKSSVFSASKLFGA